MMNLFTKSISNVLKGTAGAFHAYPAAMASALGFALVAMVRIQLDWQAQEPYDFLFNCLHFALALGAVFGLTAVTGAKSKSNDAASFRLANLLGAAVVIVTFLLLYFFSSTGVSPDGTYRVGLSDVAQARVTAAMLVSLLAFIILAGAPQDRSDFARAFFMTHKAFFIALIYGVVLYAGGAGVAGAVEALLYRNMSGKVYMYIGTVAGFLAYAIFIGYFPDFSRDSDDPKRETAQKQPRFIEILLEFIICPLALALTAVLLIWSGKTALTGEQVPFLRLSSIAAAFATVGLWLHIMVTHAQSGLARFFRKSFPFAALVILIFEAWVLFVQVEKWGLKTAEYFFILVWILTMASALLLILMRGRSHGIIAVLLSALAVFSVLPGLGYHALPVKMQVDRLEKLLTAQGMLSDDVPAVLTPASSEPERAVREAVTAAVDYLAYARDARLPSWFDRQMAEYGVFEKIFGFTQTWPGSDPGAQPGDYVGTYLYLPAGAVDVSGYRWAVNTQGGRMDMPVTVEGDRGVYEIFFWNMESGRAPVLRIDLDGRTVHEEDMRAYFDEVLAQYPPGNTKSSEASMEEMSYSIEIPEAKILLVFENVSVNTNTATGVTDYWLSLWMLCLSD